MSYYDDDYNYGFSLDFYSAECFDNFFDDDDDFEEDDEFDY